MIGELWRIAGILAAGLASAGAMAAPAGAFEPRVPDTFFGVSAPELWALTEVNAHGKRDTQLDGMKAAGIDWARVEVGWPEIEPAGPVGGVHAYDWEIGDELMAAMASRHMELMALPMATPGWARSDDAAAADCERGAEVAPGRVDDYAAFVGAFMNRYGVAGSFWTERPDLPRVPVRRVEVWNEANWSAFWCPRPDPELFATMTRAAAERIHAVDPGAQVILGGLAALREDRYQNGQLRGIAADEFLRRAIEREPGLLESIDAVGFHPYDVDPAMNLSLIGGFRRALVDLGLGDAEIALTEFGWRAAEESLLGQLLGAISELLRADNYERMANEIARTDCGISAVAAHTWSARALDVTKPHHWYGITDWVTGALKPSGVAYRDQIALFEGRGDTPAPREVIGACGAPAPPDHDGDGVPDEDDDYPLDPSRHSNPDAEPSSETGESRTHVQRASDSFFGVSSVQLPKDFAYLGDFYEAMASARIGTVRRRIAWSQVEPVAPADPGYALRAGWADLDRLMINMAGVGIRLQPSFGAAPDWVTGDGFEAQYAAFMTRFAERYGAAGAFWAEHPHLDGELAVRDYEVWQYGNQGSDLVVGAASAARYARIYRAARGAVRADDGEARALVSARDFGSAGRVGPFVRDMAAADPQLEIDAAMVMADAVPTPGWVDLMVADLRHALDATGNSGAGIFVGFGAPTEGSGAISEEDRAAFFAEVASGAARGDCGVEGLLPHAWGTPELEETNPWHWFGIADPDDWTLSPTAEAYRDVAAAFRGYGDDEAPVAAVHPCDRRAPDRDGDGTADPADPAPFDPDVSAPLADPPPAPAIRGGPASPTTEPTAAFDLTAAGATGFQCKLDGGRFRACGASPEFESLSEGEHELQARAVDSLGLVGREAAYRWAVDFSPETNTPEPPDDSPEPEPTPDDSPEPEPPPAEPEEPPAEREEPPDEAEEPPAQPVAPSADRSGPQLKVKRQRPKRFATRSRRARFRVYARDPSGVTSLEYRLDRERWRDTRKRLRLRGLSRGRHKLRLRATDAHGNRTRAKVQWRVNRRR